MSLHQSFKSAGSGFKSEMRGFRSGGSGFKPRRQTFIFGLHRFKPEGMMFRSGGNPAKSSPRGSDDGQQPSPPKQPGLPTGCRSCCAVRRASGSRLLPWGIADQHAIQRIPVRDAQLAVASLSLPHRRVSNPDQLDRPVLIRCCLHHHPAAMQRNEATRQVQTEPGQCAHSFAKPAGLHRSEPPKRV